MLQLVSSRRLLQLSCLPFSSFSIRSIGVKLKIQTHPGRLSRAVCVGLRKALLSVNLHLHYTYNSGVNCKFRCALRRF